MFQPVDPSQESLILATADKPRGKRGPDFSIRTVTHWLTLEAHFDFCTVPTHYDNVMEDFDKYPSRMCVQIGDYVVCRWCYIAEADVLAQLEGIPPVSRTDDGAT